MNARAVSMALGIALTGVLVYGITAQQKSPSGRTPLDNHRLLGAPKSFRNLTLIPVYAPGAKATNAYMTLDEGLKAKVVKVREATGGGDVNRLYITNLGRKPLYIMAGEVVVGGQQDRSFAEDSVIPPNEKEIPLTAFCVEHGRWSGKAEFDSVAYSVASKDVRASVQEGSFIAQRPSVAARTYGGSVRRDAMAGLTAPSEAIGKAQQQVWDKVAVKNRKFQAENATGTYRTLLNAEAGEAKKTIGPYVKAFEAGLDKDPTLIGALVAINGKVVSADIFGDPGLYRKLWPKLLRSYAADAAENSDAPEAKKNTVVTSKMGKEFIASAMNTKTKAVNRSKVSSITRLDSKQALLYQFKPEGKAAGGMGGFGGAGGGLHMNVIGK